MAVPVYALPVYAPVYARRFTVVPVYGRPTFDGCPGLRPGLRTFDGCPGLRTFDGGPGLRVYAVSGRDGI